MNHFKLPKIDFIFYPILHHIYLERMVYNYGRKIILKGWFSARLKLQQGDAEDIENGTGFIREEEKGLDFSATLGDDFKTAKDKETQKECVEIKLQGT